MGEKCNIFWKDEQRIKIVVAKPEGRDFTWKRVVGDDNINTAFKDFRSGSVYRILMIQDRVQWRQL